LAGAAHTGHVYRRRRRSGLAFASILLEAALVGTALVACVPAQNSTTKGISRPLTEAQRRVQYVYYLRELTPCIRALRFPVGPEPDLEDFLSQKPELAWSPWIALKSSASPREIAEVRRICPPDPVASK